MYPLYKARDIEEPIVEAKIKLAGYNRLGEKEVESSL